MISKKKAELEANALLKDARIERERKAERSTRLLLLLFPALSACAPSRRRGLVQEARRRAGRAPFAMTMAVATIVLTAAWLIALVADFGAADMLLWTALGTVVVGQLVQLAQTRLELANLLDEGGADG